MKLRNKIIISCLVCTFIGAAATGCYFIWQVSRPQKHIISTNPLDQQNYVYNEQRINSINTYYENALNNINENDSQNFIKKEQIEKELIKIKNFKTNFLAHEVFSKERTFSIEYHFQNSITYGTGWISKTNNTETTDSYKINFNITTNLHVNSLLLDANLTENERVKPYTELRLKFFGNTNHYRSLRLCNKDFKILGNKTPISSSSIIQNGIVDMSVIQIKLPLSKNEPDEWTNWLKTFINPFYKPYLENETSYSDINPKVYTSKEQFFYMGGFPYSNDLETGVWEFQCFLQLQNSINSKLTFAPLIIKDYLQKPEFWIDVNKQGYKNIGLQLLFKGFDMGAGSSGSLLFNENNEGIAIWFGNYSSSENENIWGAFNTFIGAYYEKINEHILTISPQYNLITQYIKA